MFGVAAAEQTVEVTLSKETWFSGHGWGELMILVGDLRGLFQSFV